MPKRYHGAMAAFNNKRRGRVRERLLAKAGHTCQHCGATDVRLTFDHIVPRSKGGSMAQHNLQVLCEPCNQAKADTMPEALSA
jgi:5-methylcytosine-specific restriction endonuclease McrA